MIACDTKTVIITIIVVITLPSNKNVSQQILYIARETAARLSARNVSNGDLLTMVLLHRSTRRTVKEIGHILSLCTSLFFAFSPRCCFPAANKSSLALFIMAIIHPFIHPSLLCFVQFNNCLQLATHEQHSFLINSCDSHLFLLSSCNQISNIRKTHIH